MLSKRPGSEDRGLEIGVAESSISVKTPRIDTIKRYIGAIHLFATYDILFEASVESNQFDDVMAESGTGFLSDSGVIHTLLSTSLYQGNVERSSGTRAYIRSIQGVPGGGSCPFCGG